MQLKMMKMFIVIIAVGDKDAVAEVDENDFMAVNSTQICSQKIALFSEQYLWKNVMLFMAHCSKIKIESWTTVVRQRILE